MNRQGAIRYLITGLSSCAALAALLVGVPVVLSTLAGWPLPRTIPDLDRITAVLGSRDELPSATVVKAVALVGWVAWVEITLAVVFETTGRLRGHRIPRLRLPGAGGAQALAAHLVAGVLLLAGTRQPIPAAQPLTAIVAVSSVTPTTPAPPAATAPAPVGPEYTVRSGDWLSTIARDQLGDLKRYPEITALNMGRPQPDGRALEDEDVIHPGWRLRLPPATNGVRAPASDSSLVPSVPVDSGVAAPSIGALPNNPAGPATAPPAADHVDNSTCIPIASQGAGGDTDALGTEPAPERTSPAPNSRPPESGDGAPSSPWTVPAAVVPAVVAGVAILRLTRLRANQQRHRRRGRTIAPPPDHLQGHETRIRAVADTEAPAWVDAATRRLWTALEATPADEIPAVVAVRGGALGVEFLLDRVAPVPPPGFVSADAGRSWRLDHHGDLATLTALVDGQSSALPGLLHVGDTPEGPLWLDLERAGTLSIEGDPDRVDAFLAGAATHLATAPWSDALDVLLIGGDERLTVADHVRSATASDAMHAAAHAAASPARHRLAARVIPPAMEAMAPTVVLALAANLGPATANCLTAAAQPDSGFVLVAVGPFPQATWRLVFEPDGSALLEPLHLKLTYVSQPATTNALAEFVAHAAGQQDVALPEPDSHEALPEQDPDIAPVDAAPVGIRILGPVEIDWGGPAPRTKAAEIVAYLATRERPVPGDRLRVDVWPAPSGGEVADATFRTNVSRARSALGTDPDGNPHLREAEHGCLRLGSGITTDWHRFQQLTAAARHAPTDEAIEHYREAITLIRGAPFADPPKGAYHWIHSDGLVWDIETAVAEAVERFADLALDAGEHRLADWAARQALKVVPHRETLYQVRMKAAHQAGDHDALERIYRDLRLILRSLGELEEPQPETIAVYQSLSGRAVVPSISTH